MTNAAAVRRDPRKLLAWAWLAGALLVALGGCASPSRPEGGGAPDILTESDEPEARRRARIRMELAVGYFEQGQTNVALDELKQVIAIDPAYPDAYNLRGLIYMRLNDIRQAEESFRRAVSLNPRDGNVQHNYGWLLCQQARYEEAGRAFEAAMASPVYPGRAKTLMAQGICEAKAGRLAEAERSLARSYELDAANPVTGYTLAGLLFRRGDFVRAQFYIRRLNNSDAANAETLWLGVRVERSLGDRVAMQQLGDQLKKRFPRTREALAYDRGAFDE
ncbi:type IV pilus biogenesis/stability protein PilW [Caenimonas aquaedulcis]|uniref:Type IV pilus biogenesis/stability protein PilW n=1 Tax=Caenimonas aquaedulcis TaxID=2793270 RepID=A0A931H1H8_9BURK|nr:type IV pilus biogenesis/stability protein PilW [Caenimonas aquaedulcis]MBG9386815.1 type IV pilus biogenesis/stability protein PilW [Caenimonas aquaedulcis]